jgi:hypothetical protein
VIINSVHSPGVIFHKRVLVLEFYAAPDLCVDLIAETMAFKRSCALQSGVSIVTLVLVLSLRGETVPALFLHTSSKTFRPDDLSRKYRSRRNTSPLTM